MDLPVVIPKIVPEELHDLWLSLTESSQNFLLAHADEPERFISLLRMNIPIATDAQESAKRIHSHIASKSTQEQLKLFPFPTELTRTTPFFPMSKNEMKERPYIKELIISHSWGEIVYSGPKLSVYDEDLLMYLLAAINEANEKYIDQVDGIRTYTYRGSLHRILMQKGMERASKRDYEEALNSFKMMTGARIDLTTHTTGPGGKRIPKKTTFKSLIVGGEFDHETGEFVCTVNPYFLETYDNGQVTWLDVAIRSKLTSPIAKALFRFVQSHREDRWQGPVVTLATSLNLNLELPPNKLRERIRSAIKDLIEVGVLLNTSCVNKDTVVMFRNPKSHSKKFLAGKKISSISA